MQYLELSDGKIINLDQVAWIDFTGACEGAEGAQRGCVHFGGAATIEWMVLEREDVEILKSLSSFNGYAYPIGNYLINLQKASNIKIRYKEGQPQTISNV